MKQKIVESEENTTLNLGYTKEMIDTMKTLQENCNSFIKELITDRNISYDAAQTTWMFVKFAQIEVSLRSIEKLLQVKH